jgi:hypothetical protein
MKRIFLLILLFLLPSISGGFYHDDPFHDRYVQDRIDVLEGVVETLKAKVSYYDNHVLSGSEILLTSDEIDTWVAIVNQIRIVRDQIEELKEQLK